LYHSLEIQDLFWNLGQKKYKKTISLRKEDVPKNIRNKLTKTNVFYEIQIARYVARMIFNDNGHPYRYQHNPYGNRPCGDYVPVF
jgi:hypothetical protein